MVIVAMRVALDVDVAGHHEIAILDAHDLDRRAVETRQHRSGDDVVDRPDHRLAPAEIEHAVDRIDQRIELVGAEQNRNLQIVANAPCGFNDALLMRRVERDQRLVEQQQTRPADERLAQQHPLALAARQFADRAAGELARAHFVERPVDLAPRRLVERDEAEAAADRRAGDDVPAGQPQACDCPADLRDVADLGVAARYRPPKHRDLARSYGNETKRGAHKRRLAGAVRAQHADELALLDLEAGGREDVPAAEPDRHIVERQARS